MMENYTPKFKVNKVLWEMLSEGWIKVNTDGASRGNPGRSSIGYCLKNELGDVIYVCGKEVHETTNTVAESLAILEALRYCRLHQPNNIWLETNSIMVRNVIVGNWKPPWAIVMYVEEIKQILEAYNTKMTHIFREGNRLADHLANYALDFGPIKCVSFAQLDVRGKGIVNDDKLQCPYLRIRVSRN